jgi:hypothetical protein
MSTAARAASNAGSPTNAESQRLFRELARLAVASFEQRATAVSCCCARVRCCGGGGLRALPPAGLRSARPTATATERDESADHQQEEGIERYLDAIRRRDNSACLC